MSHVITDLGPALHGVSQVTHHHLGLVLLLVGAGQPAEGLQQNTSITLWKPHPGPCSGVSPEGRT